MIAIETTFSFVFQNKYVLKDFQIEIKCGLNVSKVFHTYPEYYLSNYENN